MQRFMIAEKNGKGIAVINDCKYSSSIKNGVLSFIAARSCYYADHFAVRDQRMRNIDMGEQKFKYEIMPFENKLSKDYEKLGVIYYNAIKDADGLDEKTNALKTAIEQKLGKIEKIKKEMNEAKNKRLCPECGISVDKNSAFCSSCGAKLEFED